MSSDRNVRIEELVEQLKKITLELEDLRNCTENDKKDEAETIKIGDTVRVTNNYKGEHGTEGKVTRVTRARVTVVTSAGKTIVRSKNNVEIVRSKDDGTAAKQQRLERKRK